MRFAPVQCLNVGSAPCRAACVTAKAISGRVETIAYIKDPTKLRYGTLDISARSSDDMSAGVAVSLSVAAGVGAGLQSVMLYFLRMARM